MCTLSQNGYGSQVMYAKHTTSSKHDVQQPLALLWVCGSATTEHAQQRKQSRQTQITKAWWEALCCGYFSHSMLCSQDGNRTIMLELLLDFGGWGPCPPSRAALSYCARPGLNCASSQWRIAALAGGTSQMVQMQPECRMSELTLTHTPRLESDLSEVARCQCLQFEVGPTRRGRGAAK